MLVVKDIPNLGNSKFHTSPIIFERLIALLVDLKSQVPNPKFQIISKFEIPTVKTLPRSSCIRIILLKPRSPCVKGVSIGNFSCQVEHHLKMSRCSCTKRNKPFLMYDTVICMFLHILTAIQLTFQKPMRNSLKSCS